MPNAFIDHIDSNEPVTARSALIALARVPFVAHQFRWLVCKVAAETHASALATLQGYSGMKRSSLWRDVRLDKVVAAIRTLSPAALKALPETLTCNDPRKATVASIECALAATTAPADAEEEQGQLSLL